MSGDVFLRFVVGGILLISLCSGSIAQDSLNISMTARLYSYWSEVYGLDVSGDYAYVADEDAGLHIIDISAGYHRAK